MNKYISDVNKRIEEYKIRLENTERISLGRSILGADIDCYKVGAGKKNIVGIGSHSGTEHVTALHLFDFIAFMTDNATRYSTHYGINIEFLLQKFTFWIIPCPNPDGLKLHLLSGFDNPLRERQMRMGAGNYSSWRYNARGVDLGKNYRYGHSRLFSSDRGGSGNLGYPGEYPESEPETRSIASFVRALLPSALISFRLGEGIFCVDRKSIAEKIGVKTGVPVSVADGNSLFGELYSYTAVSLKIPSFSIGIRADENVSDRVKKTLVLLPTYL